MGKILVLIFLGLNTFFMEGKAQEHWEYKANIGYNLGGSIPLSMPVEVRSIEKYTIPVPAPHFALEATRWLNEKWGISAQIMYDHKGFTVRNKVKNLYTEIEIAGNPEPQTGNFTGNNTTEIQNSYLTVPVLASYRISPVWITQLGVYASYLCRPYFKGTASDGYIRRGSPVGEKINVPNASFDFSKNQNRFDFGLFLAEEWQFYKKIAFKGQLQWGLRSLFPADFSGISFDMYNVYGTLGISYLLFSQ
jgi:hypothetical protein